MVRSIELGRAHRNEEIMKILSFLFSRMCLAAFLKCFNCCNSFALQDFINKQFKINVAHTQVVSDTIDSDDDDDDDEVCDNKSNQHL